MTRSYWLSLDFSRGAGSLALHLAEGDDRRLLATARLTRDLAQAETGLEVLSRLLKDCGVRLREVSVLLTSIGPGSFTGLRIALSTLKAFNHALQIPIETFSAAEIRALEAVERSNTNEVAVITNLGPQKRHWAHFTKDGSGVQQKAAGIAPAHEDIPLRFPEAHFVTEEEIPLEAELLGKHRFQSRSRREFLDLEAVAALSPAYEGSTEYVTISAYEMPKP